MKGREVKRLGGLMYGGRRGIRWPMKGEGRGRLDWLMKGGRREIGWANERREEGDWMG